MWFHCGFVCKAKRSGTADYLYYVSSCMSFYAGAAEYGYVLMCVAKRVHYVISI